MQRIELFQSGRAASISFLPATSMGDIRLYSPILLEGMSDEQGEDRRRLAQNGRSLGDLEKDPNLQLLIRHGSPLAFGEGDDYDEAEDGDLFVISQGPYWLRIPMTVSCTNYRLSLAVISTGMVSKISWSASNTFRLREASILQEQ
jgi:hypothetical protein